jgi:hypothetical protein
MDVQELMTLNPYRLYLSGTVRYADFILQGAPGFDARLILAGLSDARSASIATQSAASRRWKSVLNAATPSLLRAVLMPCSLVVSVSVKGSWRCLPAGLPGLVCELAARITLREGVYTAGCYAISLVRRCRRRYTA